MKRIRAIFINNPSHGFYPSRDYLLEIDPISCGIAVVAVGASKDNNAGTRIEYANMADFLRNWDMIRNV